MLTLAHPHYIYQAKDGPRASVHTPIQQVPLITNPITRITITIIITITITI